MLSLITSNVSVTIFRHLWQTTFRSGWRNLWFYHDFCSRYFRKTSRRVSNTINIYCDVLIKCFNFLNIFWKETYNITYYSCTRFIRQSSVAMFCKIRLLVVLLFQVVTRNSQSSCWVLTSSSRNLDVLWFKNHQAGRLKFKSRVFYWMHKL